MRKGTTPTNTFSVPIDLSAATVFITYAQSGDNLVGSAVVGTAQAG